MKTPRIPSVRRAFTLAEVIVGFGLNVLVVTLSLATAVTLMRVYHRTELRDTVNSDYRALVQRLETVGRGANTFHIFPSFAESDRVRSVPTRIGVGAGESGDFVVFVYYTVGDLAAGDIRSAPEYQTVSRIVGVYRENSGSALGAIRWFDTAAPDCPDWPNRPTPQNPLPLYAIRGVADGKPYTQFDASAGGYIVAESTPIERMLPPASLLTAFPKLADLTLGTAAAGTASNPNTFYNDGNRAVIVSGLLYKRRGDTGSEEYETRNAFNLSLSPRS